MRFLKWIGWTILVSLAIVGALVIAGGVALTYGLRDFAKFENPVPERAVLTLDLADGVVETTAGNPFVLAGIDKKIGLGDLIQGLEAAGRDPRIAGLVVRLGSGALGLARADEIAGAVRAFRKQGKFALAFAESFGEAGDGNTHYFLATAFDQIWLQPSGSLGLTGLRIEAPFLRTALDELGVAVRMDRRREYKGAIDSLLADAMPAPLAENLQRLVDSMTGRDRRGDRDAARRRAHRRPRLDRRRPLSRGGRAEGEAGRSAGLLGRVRTEVDKRSSHAAERYTLADYASQLSPPEGATRVAIVYGLGPIALGESDQDPLLDRWSMGARTVSAAIREARLDDSVKAIILRVDSPGGSYVAADTIWREVDEARRGGKPVIVSMGDVAASGGYFVAAPATTILADPTTITGSIGVFGGKLVLTGLWDKLGIRWEGVQSGANADIDSFNRDYSPAGWSHLEAELDRVYADFTAKVAAGRKLAPDKVEAVAKGQVWSGSDALANGLVDRLGGLAEAIATAREMLGLAPGTAIALVSFPTEAGSIQAYLGRFLGGERIEPRIGAGRVPDRLARDPRARGARPGRCRGPAPRGRADRARALTFRHTHAMSQQSRPSDSPAWPRGTGRCWRTSLCVSPSERHRPPQPRSRSARPNAFNRWLPREIRVPSA